MAAVGAGGAEPGADGSSAREGHGAALVGPGQPHGALQIGRRLELDIGADRIRKAAGEELNLLQRG